jgi:transketolase
MYVEREALSQQEQRATAYRLSRRILQMTTEAGSGHPSSSLSAIDVLVALYFGGVLRFDPNDPQWPQRDRFIMSKGHAAPALYAVLAEAGYFDVDRLATLRELGSALEGHPNMRALPGVEASTGSLGQGLSIGLGHALAGRMGDDPFRVYVMIGDGESDEGQIWEAAMAASKYEVDNLVAILDYNEFQQTGPVATVMPSLRPIAEKWAAFGWWVDEVDGHDLQAVGQSLRAAQEVSGQPQMLIAHTKKGKGLPVFEADDVNRRHGEPLSAEELQRALQELDEMYA